MRSATPYSPPTFAAPIDLDLSKNEGRAPSSLLSRLPDGELTSLINRYPDTSQLREELAAMHGVAPDQILVTAGGDDALFRCFLARMGPGRTGLCTHPTFEMIPRYSTQLGARLIEVPWEKGDFPCDAAADAMGDSVDVAFVVSPNNPTGAVIDEVSLRRLADRAGLVVLDAAYAEFADLDLTPIALEFDNVVVIRTLSKAWGLAGLRVGYLIGPAPLVVEIGAYGNPYAVTGLSQALARLRLSEHSEVEAFVAEVRDERDKLGTTLARYNVEVLPSQANFVLARFEDPEWVVSAAASLGVALRRFPDTDGLENHLRITLPGNRQRFERLIHVLSSAVAPEAVLFDLDGVLADVEDSQTQSIIKTAAQLGVTLTRSDVEIARAAGNASDDWELTWRLCSSAGATVSLAEVTERFEALYQGTHTRPGLKRNESALVDVETMRRWAKEVAVGVVTGRPRRDAGEFLDSSGLADCIDVVITREDAPLKPSSEPVSLAMRRLGVTRAWMLGDTPDDIAAARGAGVVPIGVVAKGRDPALSHDSLTNAARVLNATTDLEVLLP